MGGHPAIARDGGQRRRVQTAAGAFAMLAARGTPFDPDRQRMPAEKRRDRGAGSSGGAQVALTRCSVERVPLFEREVEELELGLAQAPPGAARAKILGIRAEALFIRGLPGRRSSRSG